MTSDNRVTGEPTADELATVAARVLPLLDLTSLGDDDTPGDIERLCSAAPTPAGPVASVCVWPRFVAQSVELLAGTGIPVAAVANFPDGDDDDHRARADAAAIVAAGGAEVDVVVPWRRLAIGDDAAVTRLVAATRAEIGNDIVLKAILETGELDDDELAARAGRAALAGGADFLKTSTGKTARSATPEAAMALLAVLTEPGAMPTDRGRPIGLKVSGGVGTAAEAATYLAMADGAFGDDAVGPATLRFGASRLLADLLARLGH
ncbi:MAG: deoxyribose-phosphate aldolase [Actinomycetota bacterium]